MKYFKLCRSNFIFFGLYALVYFFPEYQWVVKTLYWIIYPLTILALIIVMVKPKIAIEKQILTIKRNLLYKILDRCFDIVHLSFFAYSGWKDIFVLYIIAEIIKIWTIENVKVEIKKTKKENI